MQEASGIGIEQFWMDLAQLIGAAVAIVGAGVAVFKALDEVRLNREQRDRQLEEAKVARALRDRDLRWRQAEDGKRLVDEMTADRYARAAMYMLDWDKRTFEISKGVYETISHDEMFDALQTKDEYEPKEQFIRDCFDAFFSYLVFIEQGIENGMIEREHIDFPVRYYVNLMGLKRDVYSQFLDEYDYKRAMTLIAGFDEWSNPKQPKRLNQRPRAAGDEEARDPEAK